MPIIGTKINNKKNSIKQGNVILFKKLVSIAEMIIIIESATKVKSKCLVKKK